MWAQRIELKCQVCVVSVCLLSHLTHLDVPCSFYVVVPDGCLSPEEGERQKTGKGRDGCEQTGI